MNARDPLSGLEARENFEIKVSRTRTWGGMETKAAYTPNDVKDIDYQRDLGNPGEFPYTRGAYPQMYRTKMWTQRQMFGWGAPEDTRQGIERGIARGIKGVGIIPDPVTEMGIDADHPAFALDIGKDGVSISSMRDIEVLMAGMDLTSVDIAWHSAQAFPMVVALARKQGIALSNLQGGSMPDFMTKTICQAKHVLPPELSHRMQCDILEYVVRNVPKWSLGFPQGYKLRERGLTPSAEIAVGMANVISTVDKLIVRGLTIDQVAPSIAWITISDIDFLEEIAKFRALRRFWARTMKERFGAKTERAMRLRLACHTGGRSLVYRQPLNNMTRIAIEAVAAVLGGVQSLDCCTYDEPICIPTHEARELALRAQQIIASEVGVARTADPLGGSYYIESLTNAIEAEAAQLLQKFDEMGFVNAVDDGYLEKIMDEYNFELEKELDTADRVVIGLNKFVPEEEPAPTRFEFDPTHTEAHIKRLVDLKKTRDNRTTAEHLRRVYKDALEGRNTYGAIIDAYSADATLGEVWGALRTGHGLPYDPFNALKPPFEFI